MLAAVDRAAEVLALPGLFGGPARLLRAAPAGLDLLLLDAPHLFGRPGNPYSGPDGGPWADNGIRFAALSAAAALVAKGGVPGLGFDAVHAHDWQAGLVGAYLRHGGGGAMPLVFTIHNLAFQGQFPAGLFPALGLPPAAYATDGIEYFGQLGYLKAGLWFADRITTVSPTYAAEILTAEGGMGLDGLLRGRADAVSGILNGIDEAEWNPATDPHLPARFDAADPSPRAANKAALQRPLRLGGGPGGAAVPVHRPARLAEGHRPGAGGVADAAGRWWPACHPRHRRCGAGAALPGSGPARPGRRGDRLRRIPGAAGLWRRRCRAGAVALRALRPRPALRPALRRIAGGRPGRRAGGYA